MGGNKQGLINAEHRIENKVIVELKSTSVNQIFIRSAAIITHISLQSAQRTVTLPLLRDFAQYKEPIVKIIWNDLRIILLKDSLAILSKRAFWKRKGFHTPKHNQRPIFGNLIVPGDIYLLSLVHIFEYLKKYNKCCLA